MRVYSFVILEKGCILLLFGSYNTYNKGYRVYLIQRQLERLVCRIVRYENDVSVIAPASHTLDDYSLLTIDYINTIPLEECIERQTLAGYNITAVIFRLHRIAAYAD